MSEGLKKKAGRPKGSKNKKTAYRENVKLKAEKAKERKSPNINPTFSIVTNIVNTNLCASALIQQIAKRSQSADLKLHEMKAFASIVKSCQDTFIGTAKFLHEAKRDKMPLDFDQVAEHLQSNELKDKSAKELVNFAQELIVDLQTLEEFKK